MGSWQSSSLGDNGTSSFFVEDGKVIHRKAKKPRSRASQGDAKQDRLEANNQKESEQSSAINDDVPQKQTENGFSLREADEMITRMKAEYKPNSAELAGMKSGMFEEIERKLLHCYKTHKNQPLACAKLSKEYQDCVREQRSKLLQGTVKSDISPVAA